MNLTDFGKELRALRRKHFRGITLADAADHLGCSIALLSAIERGQRNPPSDSKLIELLRFYNCESEVDRILELARSTRRVVELKLDNSNPKTKDVLLGLARRLETGCLNDDDPVVKGLTRLLTEGEGSDGDGATS